MLPCKAKKQYLLTLQVGRYCILALQRSMVVNREPGNKGSGKKKQIKRMGAYSFSESHN